MRKYFDMPFTKVTALVKGPNMYDLHSSAKHTKNIFYRTLGTKH